MFKLCALEEEGWSFRTFDRVEKHSYIVFATLRIKKFSVSVIPRQGQELIG